MGRFVIVEQELASPEPNDKSSITLHLRPTQAKFVKPVVFAEAFYWIALTNPADATHDEAQALEQSLDSLTILTTDEVPIEFLTFFGSDPWLRFRAAKTAQGLLRKTNVRVVAQTRNSFLAGLEHYSTRLDKGYSLTDCISMRDDAPGGPDPGADE